MAKDDITLSRREHRELARKFEAILAHHTNTKERKSPFDAVHDADVHENEDYDVHRDDPQCSVITHAQDGLRLLREKGAK